jgi:hypothetical protein
VEAAGNEVIPGAFGVLAVKTGCFNLEESLGIEEFTDTLEDTMPCNQVIPHRGPADIEVAVLEADILGNGVTLG